MTAADAAYGYTASQTALAGADLTIGTNTNLSNKINAMAKKQKRKIPKRRRRPGEQTSHEQPNVDEALDLGMWQQGNELHVVGRGKPPDAKMLEEMTNKFREGIRNSPMWQQMVEEFGAERAEELLLEIRADVRR